MVDCKVTVCCVTFNHKNYIAQALDGFVMQKTNFPFQVLVGDDASTDGTTEIVREYAEKYPDIIKPIFHEKNIGVFKNSLSLYQAAKTEYVAICDGDDYWTDVLKLQKQVDFLDAHSDFSVCFHPVTIHWTNDSKQDRVYPSEKQRFIKTELFLTDLLKCNFIQTNSVMFRWRFKKENILNYWSQEIAPGDYYLNLLHAKVGKIGFLPDIMAVYRKHAGGIWYNMGKSDLHYVDYGLSHLNFITKVREQFGYFHEQFSLDYAKNTLLALLNHKEFEKLNQFSEQFPEFYAAAVKRISEQIEAYQNAEKIKKCKQNKWRKLCGRIVKWNKTTYYFLFIPIMKIRHKST